MASPRYTTPPAPTHLWVVMHGFMGFSDNVTVLAKRIRERHGAQSLVVVPRCFAVLRTLDGVDVCAQRVLAEIRALVDAHPSLRALSLIGYSMGGLVARYLAGVLHVSRPAPFLGLEPINLVTIACPHLGPRLAHDISRGTRLLFFLARTIGGRSAEQMTSADHGLQLLALMAHRRSAFYRGLAAFEYRAAYANAFGDRTVPWWSAFISEWSGGEPMQPPPDGTGYDSTCGWGPSAKHPHVEWAGVTGPIPCTMHPARGMDGAEAVAAGKPAEACGSLGKHVEVCRMLSAC